MYLHMRSVLKFQVAMFTLLCCLSYLNNSQAASGLGIRVSNMHTPLVLVICIQIYTLYCYSEYKLDTEIKRNPRAVNSLVELSSFIS